MIVSEEHHRVLVISITHLRAEAMRLMPRLHEHAEPLAPQMGEVIDSLTGIEHEIEDIRPGDDHDLREIVQGLTTIGWVLTEIAGHLDRAKVMREGRLH